MQIHLSWLLGLDSMIRLESRESRVEYTNKSIMESTPLLLCPLTLILSENPSSREVEKLGPNITVEV
jgi:hypothetical protein